MQHAGIFEPRAERRRFPQQIDGIAHVALGLGKTLLEIAELVRTDVVRDAAGPDPAAAEPAAAQFRGEVQHVTTQAAAIGCCRQEANIAGQGTEIADMIGDPLQFDRHGTQRIGARRAFVIGQPLEELGVG